MIHPSGAWSHFYEIVKIGQGHGYREPRSLELTLKAELVDNTTFLPTSEECSKDVPKVIQSGILAWDE